MYIPVFYHHFHSPRDIVVEYIDLGTLESKMLEPMYRRSLVRRNLYHRPSIQLPRIDIVVGDREDQDSASHQTAPIHMRRIRVHHLREEAEDEHNDTIPNAKRVEQYPPYPRDVEGAPDKLVRMPCGTCHLTAVANRASDAVPEEEGLGKDIGCIETAHADGDDGVKGDCGADVDQANGTGYSGHDCDCVQRDRGLCLNL